jgi:hypothetical protein
LQQLPQQEMKLCSCCFVVQAEAFFAQQRHSAGSSRYAAAAALLAKRLAQLPRPVMANRSNSSITINVDRRGAADAYIQVNQTPLL